MTAALRGADSRSVQIGAALLLIALMLVLAVVSALSPTSTGSLNHSGSSNVVAAGTAAFGQPSGTYHDI